MDSPGKNEIPDALPSKPFPVDHLDQKVNRVQTVLHQNLRELIFRMNVEYWFSTYDLVGCIQAASSEATITATRHQAALVTEIRRTVAEARERLGVNSIDVLGVLEALKSEAFDAAFFNSVDDDEHGWGNED